MVVKSIQNQYFIESRIFEYPQEEQLCKLAVLSNRIKTKNELVYYIIDRIQTAILEHRQVEFYYELLRRKRKSGNTMVKYYQERFPLHTWRDKDKIEIDCGVGHSHLVCRLTCICLEDMVEGLLESV